MPGSDARDFHEFGHPDARMPELLKISGIEAGHSRL
jgi:hypothetical protein